MKTIIVTLAVLLSCSAGYSQSRQSSKFHFSLDGGLNKYINNTNYNPGLVMSLKGGYRLSNNSIAGIKFDYSANNFTGFSWFENSYSKVIRSARTVDVGVKAFFMYGNFKKSARFRPYFIIAAGPDFIKSTGLLTLNNGTISGSYFHTHFGMDFGVGLDYKLSENLSMYVQPGFKGIFISGNTSSSVKMGMMFNP